jgi:hypothetical protein
VSNIPDPHDGITTYRTPNRIPKSQALFNAVHSTTESKPYRDQVGECVGNLGDVPREQVVCLVGSGIIANAAIIIDVLRVATSHQSRVAVTGPKNPVAIGNTA